MFPTSLQMCAKFEGNPISSHLMAVYCKCAKEKEKQENKENKKTRKNKENE